VSETDTSKSENNEVKSIIDNIKSMMQVSETDTSNQKNTGIKQNTDTNKKTIENKPTLKKKSTELGSQINVAKIEDKLTKNITEIEIHPAVISLPRLSNDEFIALEADILRSGMINPIIINKKYQCIDGRARLEIMCKNPSVKPVVKIQDISDNEVLDYAVGQNIIRRHLNKGQRAVFAAKIYTDFVEKRKNIKEQIELNKKQIVNKKQKDEKNKELQDKKNEELLVKNEELIARNKELTFLGIRVEEGVKSRTAVAKYFSIGETVLSRACTIMKNTPELLDVIMEDTMTFEEAYFSATGKSLINEVLSDEVGNPENETPSQSSSTSYDEANEIVRKYEETKKGKQTTDSEEIKSAKLTPREEFEKTYRCLKPLEATFLEFLKNDLNIAKSEESLTAILTKEEQNKKALTIKRTDDENFDKLCQIFMDLVLTEKISEIEQLNF
jgi:hypothetical protein